MRTGRIGLLAALLVAVGIGSIGIVLAAPTAEQKEKLNRVSLNLTRANEAFKDKKYQDSGKLLEEVEKQLAELSKEKDNIKAIEGVAARAKTLHTNLELQGVKLAPAPALENSSSAAKPTPGGAAGKGTISFTKQVGPLLVGKCGRCHVTEARGGFSMNTFAALMKGNNDGVVVMAGKGSGSRIVEVVESGDMPRGGTKVTKEELAMLTKWIDEGAKFDGTDPAASLARLAPATRPMPTEPAVPFRNSTGKETVSFARDIAPVLAASCTGCHGAMQPQARLNLDQFTTLLRGSENGRILATGQPAESLIVKKLKGTAGARMPLNRPALTNDVIAKFEKWISEGATYDGLSPTQAMAIVAATYKAQHASHEELTSLRATGADKTFRLAVPDEKPGKVQTTNFTILGNLPTEMLEEVGKTAEAQAAQISKILKAPADAPLVKGRITLFALRDKPDYAEFGKMVEDGKVPNGWRGHWRYTIIDSYGAFLHTRGETAMNGVMGQQIAATYVASLGQRVPTWFAEGAGRTIASRIDAKDTRVKTWDERVPDVISGLGKPYDFMARDSFNEDDNIAAYSYMKWLMGSGGPKFNALLHSLRGGEEFSEAFKKAFGGSTPEQLSATWAAAALRKPVRKK